ncbi:MAG: ATP-binding cassette domain-containing protein [Erysipelotrichaceae bacterium]|nr:ATP-binding cassette domain-containing protein [Erysipelotrichaceae bacterium]
MLSVNNVSLQFGGRVLFKDVNITFQPQNCYGIIGANGAGKSTFLKILSGEIEPNSGDVSVSDKERMSILKQNQNAYDDELVVDTVLLGHPRLMEIQREKDALYSKPDFDENDGILAGELEEEFAELDGYEADANARQLLNSLGINGDLQDKYMRDLDSKQKVKVLLAQALFGNPDILILDEPTNNLDAIATRWLENFLYNFENTVIIVSHDRHFLNKVCTRILDVDYGKIQLYVGNYDFWYESSQLLLKQAKDQNMKAEARKKELEEFIARFSANASKSKQATSRKKELEKITIEDLRPSSRRYPFIDFKFEKELGQDILFVENLSKPGLFKNLSFTLKRGDKVAFISPNSNIINALFAILANDDKDYTGSFKYGITVVPTYLPTENSKYFDNHQESLVDWLRPYSSDQHESYLRGWLGRMLFSGEEALKPVSVLSGGEKVRCMMAKTMLTAGNLLILNEPTNHLDLEAITALNKGMINYKGVLLFNTHDHELMQTVANRIIYIDSEGFVDKQMTYDEYLDSLEK